MLQSLSHACLNSINDGYNSIYGLYSLYSTIIWGTSIWFDKKGFFRIALYRESTLFKTWNIYIWFCNGLLQPIFFELDLLKRSEAFIDILYPKLILLQRSQIDSWLFRVSYICMKRSLCASLSMRWECPQCCYNTAAHQYA